MSRRAVSQALSNSVRTETKRLPPLWRNRALTGTGGGNAMSRLSFTQRRTALPPQTLCWHRTLLLQAPSPHAAHALCQEGQTQNFQHKAVSNPPVLDTNPPCGCTKHPRLCSYRQAELTAGTKFGFLEAPKKNERTPPTSLSSSPHSARKFKATKDNNTGAHSRSLTTWLGANAKAHQRPQRYRLSHRHSRKAT